MTFTRDSRVDSIDGMIELSLDSSTIHIQLEPKVQYVGYVKLLQNNEVVGSIDAIFDFSKMPPEHHNVVLSVLHGHDVVVRKGFVPIEQSDVKITKWWKFW